MYATLFERTKTMTPAGERRSCILHHVARENTRSTIFTNNSTPKLHNTNVMINVWELGPASSHFNAQG